MNTGNTGSNPTPPPSTTEEVINIVAQVGGAAASMFLPAGMLLTVLQYGIKYGPTAVEAIIALMKQQTVTVTDVENLFANLKTYESYGIPDTIPLIPAATKA